MFTNGAILARNLDPFLVIVFAFGDCCSALPTVQTGPLGNTLEFTEKMVVWSSFLINKNPAIMRSVFPTSLQQSNQRIGQRYGSGFVRLRGEVNILLSTNVVSFFVEINVAPGRKRNFLVAASGAEEELIANLFFF